MCFILILSDFACSSLALVNTGPQDITETTAVYLSEENVPQIPKQSDRWSV